MLSVVYAVVVCLSHSVPKLHQIFVASNRRPWLSPPPLWRRSDMLQISGFCRWRHVFSSYEPGCTYTFKVIYQCAALLSSETSCTTKQLENKSIVGSKLRLRFTHSDELDHTAVVWRPTGTATCRTSSKHHIAVLDYGPLDTRHKSDIIHKSEVHDVSQRHQRTEPRP